MVLTYPACFYEEEDGYSVIIPDFQAATQGDDLKEAIYMAEDLIAGLIIDYIEDGKSIPRASDPTSELLETEEYGKGFVSVVLVDMDKKEEEFKAQNKAVKKTLTIPYWLNERAIKANINFSQTLSEALLEKLS